MRHRRAAPTPWRRARRRIGVVFATALGLLVLMALSAYADDETTPGSSATSLLDDADAAVREVVDAVTPDDPTPAADAEHDGGDELREVAVDVDEHEESDADAAVSEDVSALEDHRAVDGAADDETPATDDPTTPPARRTVSAMTDAVTDTVEDTVAGTAPEVVTDTVDEVTRRADEAVDDLAGTIEHVTAGATDVVEPVSGRLDQLEDGDPGVAGEVIDRTLGRARSLVSPVLRDARDVVVDLLATVGDDAIGPIVDDIVPPPTGDREADAPRPSGDGSAHAPDRGPRAAIDAGHARLALVVGRHTLGDRPARPTVHQTGQRLGDRTEPGHDARKRERGSGFQVSDAPPWPGERTRSLDVLSLPAEAGDGGGSTVATTDAPRHGLVVGSTAPAAPTGSGSGDGPAHGDATAVTGSGDGTDRGALLWLGPADDVTQHIGEPAVPPG